MREVEAVVSNCVIEPLTGEPAVQAEVLEPCSGGRTEINDVTHPISALRRLRHGQVLLAIAVSGSNTKI